jgi:hypothetical protein
MLHRKSTRVLTLLVLCVVLINGPWQINRVQAQAIAVSWEKPVNISNTVGCSSQPSIAADAYGNVHVFWSEDTLGRRCNGTPVAGGSIYYSRRSGDEWSFPVDIISTSLTASSPSAVVDSTGRLHLVWVQVDGIYYSSAQSWQATTAKAWAAPSQIVPARFVGTMMQLALGPNDSLDLIYADWGSGGVPTDGNVYFVESLDGGSTWSDPLQISDIAFGQQYANLPRIAVDDQGVIHAVWGTMDSSSQNQVAVYYARRGKGEKFFTSQKTIMAAKNKDKWMMAANIAVVGDQVLLTWVCGDNPYRCYQVSLDRGLAWSSPQRVFGSLLSLANYDALVVDGGGKIFWISQLRTPSAMYYSIWDRAQWTDPPTPFITYGAISAGHAPATAIGLGNQIHLVLVDQTRGEIYYSRGVTNAAAAPALSVPTSTPLPATTATHAAAINTPTAAALATIAATSGLSATPTTNSLSTEELIVLLAVVPAILLFAGVMFRRTRRLRRP